MRVERNEGGEEMRVEKGRGWKGGLFLFSLPPFLLSCSFMHRFTISYIVCGTFCLLNVENKMNPLINDLNK